MRRLLLLACTAALLALPAGAAEPEIIPCDTSAGDVVVTPADRTSGHETPQLFGDATTAEVVVDLQATTLAAKAQFTVDLTWDTPVSDYDLEVFDASGTSVGLSDGITLLDGAAESVIAGSVKHCSRFTVEVVNFGGLPIDVLSVQLTVGSVS